MLVVDDDEGARDTFALLFKSEGFHPIVVGDVPSAQRLVSAGSFSLIVLDLYWQSEPQGLELLEVLSRERRPDPVVVVTGFASVGITVQAMRLGALTVLEKPVDSGTLLGIAHRGQSAASPPQTPNEIFGRLRSEHLDLPAFLEIAAVCRMHATGKMIRADHVCRRPSGARTRRFMQLLDEGTTAALIKTEAAWGRYLLIDPAHFGRLLQAETGVFGCGDGQRGLGVP